MEDNIQKLKRYIIEAAKNPSFLHHDWFVQYHLNIFERIALELCDIYKEVDRNVVLALVWIHDYGKILDMTKEHKLNHKAGELLADADAASHMVGPFMSIYWKEYNSKSIPELVEEQKKKLTMDWERKIVLPEVKKVFEQRYKFINEQAGDFPDKFLSKIIFNSIKN